MMFGIIASVLCALTWSLSVILLKQASQRLQPLVLNLGKNVLGLILLIPTAYLIEGPVPNLSTSSMLILCLSGFFGIGIADAMVLKAIQGLSATKVAILECLFAPFVIALSILFFDESLSMLQILGILSIAASISLVLPTAKLAAPTGETQGTVFMCLGMLTMAGGILMIKPLFDIVPLFWIIAIRMLAGVVGSLLPLIFLANPTTELKKLLTIEGKGPIILGFILSAYVSISLWIAGYKLLQASIASVLNQTSTIFTVLLAVVILKEEFTPKKAMATCLATFGVIIMSVH